MFPGEEKGIVTSLGHKFELHYHILQSGSQREAQQIQNDNDSGCLDFVAHRRAKRKIVHS